VYIEHSGIGRRIENSITEKIKNKKIKDVMQNRENDRTSRREPIHLTY